MAKPEEPKQPAPQRPQPDDPRDPGRRNDMADRSREAEQSRAPTAKRPIDPN